MYKYNIQEISKEETLEMIQKYHYSNTLPKLNKYFIGFFLDGELVGVVTLGWGTRPRHTIQRIFPSLDTKDYLEIGRMCMTEEMPRNSESQMISQLVKWIKIHIPDLKVLFTWADGMVGKVGYVYQASNFIYAGYSGGEMYMKDGVKIHVRQMKSFLIPEGEKDERITVRPTLEQMKQFNIQHFKGKQYRYLMFLCSKKEKKQLLKECLIDLSEHRPKDDDLSWTIKDINTGKWVESKKPPYITDVDQKTRSIVRMESEKTMVFGDFEVFKYDWLVVLKDMKNKTVTRIHNNPDELTRFYEEHKNDIWVNHNIKHYDQYILKGILLGMNPKEINDKIIVEKMEGWQISKAFRQIPLIMYDTMPSVPVGLKTYEGFMGSNIKETDVDFNIDRPLTEEEINQTFQYCEHDVDEDIKVFLQKKSDFEAMMEIVKIFGLPLEHIGDTEARITATVLDCVKTKFDDEFEYFFLPCIQLNKYKHVMEWFDNAVADAEKEMDELLKTCKPAERWKYDKTNDEAFKKYFYSRSLTVDVAGVPHTFGFGGLHGAPDEPIHRSGQILHVDVGSYYPSMLIAWDLVTRASKHPEKYKGIYDTRMELKAQGKKKEQAPYKKMLNALSGAMKDIANPAYDPRNNNIMCINGQLMLLDLLEHLEVVPGLEVIQSNTDGLIILIPDTDEAFNMVDDICYDWEQRCSTDQCSILLGLDTIKEIYQKDVNNYIWMSPDGEVGERKGAYVKELSPLDYDLPIINKAMVDFFSKGIPVEKTINECTDLIEFQKIVKLSSNYKWVEHEHCTPRTVITGVRVKKTHYEYDQTDRYTYKSYRVFASKDMNDGRILKCGGKRGKPEKFANTPDHCFIENGDVNGVKCPDRLDKQYYINMAKERLKQYGIR